MNQKITDFLVFIKDTSALVAIISLLVSSVNVYYFYTLNNKSNSLQEEQLILHNKQISLQKNLTDIQKEVFKISNFNTTIFGGERFVHLKSSIINMNQNGTVEYFHLNGYLNTTFVIITPYYGRAEILIKNFTRYDLDLYREGLNKWTEVVFVRQPNYLYTFQGLNKFSVNLPLACIIYPNVELIPYAGESREFSIGQLYFEITFYDMQTSSNVTHEFSTGVIGKIIMPIS